MQTTMLKLLNTIVLGLMIAIFSAQAFALDHNILLIHGMSNAGNPQFGVFTNDQRGYWNDKGGRPGTTDGHVYFVQWESWNKGFDDTNCPGGWCIINHAINDKCDLAHGQECWIICHSAGCPAFENYLSKSSYATNTIFISHVMAAGSAAGGSELAKLGLGIFGPGMIRSLVPNYARKIAYEHNNMQGVMVRAIAGTSSSLCSPFKGNGGSNLNPDCKSCFGGGKACSDGVVPLHGACGHNRDESFQDCNSTIPPQSDTAGTYNFHGWWINDNVASGPFSPLGFAIWNPSFRTYPLNHRDTAFLALDEYSWAPYSLCP